MRTKTKAEKYADVFSRLFREGFSPSEIAQLLRLSKRQNTWNERLCNDTEVDDDGKAWRHTPSGHVYRTPNPEPGIRRQIAEIQGRHPDVVLYFQHDPRGCALYAVPRDVLGGCPVEAVYNRGVAVCV